MKDLHAPDPMGAAAHTAAMLCAGLDVDLLAACGASQGLSREQRAEALDRALRKWTPLCQAMVKLQEAAPNAARQAQLHHDNIQDFREGRT